MPLASRATEITVPRTEVAQNRSERGKITGRLRVALDAMIWQGMTRRQAADHAKMSEHSLYSALVKTHVRQWYLRQLDVLRTSERARNIHTLVEVRDDPANKMARVQAVKALEQLDDEVTARRGSGFSASPGLVINILNGPGVGLTRAVGVHDAETPTISTVSVPSLGERRDDE